ncbi:MAG: hypothetical protein ACREUZ_15500, partial [Burkholderiales bacterium]
VAMTCPIDSPWGEIRFEALTSANGYRVQLTRDGAVLAADWVNSSADLIPRWQTVRDRLSLMAAEAPEVQTQPGLGSGGPWWGDTVQVPASVGAAIR